MPIYEYKCSRCLYQFGVFQKRIDRPLDKCPKCGKKVKRLHKRSS